MRNKIVILSLVLLQLGSLAVYGMDDDQDQSTSSTKRKNKNPDGKEDTPSDGEGEDTPSTKRRRNVLSAAEIDQLLGRGYTMLADKTSSADDILESFHRAVWESKNALKYKEEYVKAAITLLEQGKEISDYEHERLIWAYIRDIQWGNIFSSAEDSEKQFNRAKVDYCGYVLSTLIEMPDDMDEMEFNINKAESLLLDLIEKKYELEQAQHLLEKVRAIKNVEIIKNVEDSEEGEE